MHRFPSPPKPSSPRRRMNANVSRTTLNPVIPTVREFVFCATRNLLLTVLATEKQIPRRAKRPRSVGMTSFGVLLPYLSDSEQTAVDAFKRSTP